MKSREEINKQLNEMIDGTEKFKHDTAVDALSVSYAATQTMLLLDIRELLIEELNIAKGIIKSTADISEEPAE